MTAKTEEARLQSEAALLVAAGGSILASLRFAAISRVVARGYVMSHLFRDLASRLDAMSSISHDLVHAFGVDVSTNLPPDPKAPTIYVANHIGWIDPFLVQRIAPCVPIAKSEVQSWPLVGPLVTRLGTLFVRRGDVQSGCRVLLAARALLRRGVSVLNFAEGTTTTGDRVLPLRRGILGLAQRLGINVVPVRIDYDDEGLCWVGDAPFVPNAVKLASQYNTHMRVEFRTPVAAEPDEPVASFAERVRAELM